MHSREREKLQPGSGPSQNWTMAQLLAIPLFASLLHVVVARISTLFQESSVLAAVGGLSQREQRQLVAH